MTINIYNRMQLTVPGVYIYTGYSYELAVLYKGKVIARREGAFTAMTGKTADLPITVKDKKDAFNIKVYYAIKFNGVVVAPRVYCSCMWDESSALDGNDWPQYSLPVTSGNTKDKPNTTKPQNISGACFCNREFTEKDLIDFGIPKAKATKFIDAINSTMNEYNINTCIRKLHFLAQLRHESLDFIYQAELASGSAYEGRADLGNINAGDGVRFKGRGLIQVTGRTNYGAYGSYKGESFVSVPNNKKLEQLPYCVDSAGWFWSKHIKSDLNKAADVDDLIFCTYRINGGFNGYSDRKNKLHKMLSKTKCKNKELTVHEYDFENSGCAKLTGKYLAHAKKMWARRK
jgi:predicted chitinase